MSNPLEKYWSLLHVMRKIRKKSNNIVVHKKHLPLTYNFMDPNSSDSAEKSNVNALNAYWA